MNPGPLAILDRGLEIRSPLGLGWESSRQLPQHPLTDWILRDGRTPEAAIRTLYSVALE